MSDKDLQEIQALQFTNLEKANQLLKHFFEVNLPFAVKDLTLRPLAVSLNSINGFINTDDGQKLFFKTHVEPQSIIDEYYNSTILADAGYRVIKPIYSSTEWGKQLLIYKFFEEPSLFNVARDLETNQRDDSEEIIAIQAKADRELWQIYLQTLQQINPEKHAKAPVHQLFYHRLTGGRFASFYQGQDVMLPGKTINFDKLAGMKWIVNGIEFKHTLGELVKLAIEYLHPKKGNNCAIVGHGDAHNGNVFLDKTHGSLIYFDPAFAGQHSPFLDLTKPLFHNVFAIWMYFPEEVKSNLGIEWKIEGNSLVVDHDFIPSEVRLAFLRSKLHGVLKPLLQELKKRDWLDETWWQYLKCSLFCCPFLTMNLCDRLKFPPEITLLGLAMSMEMGSSNLGAGPEGRPRGSQRQSLLDSELAGVME